MKAEDELRRVRTYTGADGRQIRVQVKQAGTAVDLSSYLGAKVSALLGSTYKMERVAATIEAGTSGWVSFTPTADQIDDEGDYKVQIRLEDGSGNIDFTSPFILEVVSPVDSAP